jgi:transposase-like protein
MARYTPEFLAALRHHYERPQRSERAIARLFGLAASTVRRIARDEGWVRPPPPARDLEPAMRLLEQTIALEAASQPRDPYVTDPYSEFAERIPLAGLTPDLREAVQRRYEQSRQSKRSIARDFGLSDRTLRRMATQEGWRRPYETEGDVLPADRILAQVIAMERRLRGDTRN